MQACQLFIDLGVTSLGFAFQRRSIAGKTVIDKPRDALLFVSKRLQFVTFINRLNALKKLSVLIDFGAVG